MGKGASNGLAGLAGSAVALSLTLTAACTGGGGRGDGGSVVRPTPVTVYAAGMDELGRAAVWKNGQPFGFIDDSGGEFWSVCAAGDVVYAVGQAPDGRPFYWKSTSNGYRYLGSGRGYATSVCVSGGQMYVAGWDASGGKVWREGSALYSFPGARAYAVCVSGSSVYAAGLDAMGACIWLNGARYGGIDDEGSGFWSLAVSGSVVYAAGALRGNPVWTKTNDYSPHILGSGGGIARSLHLSGDYLYIAGQDGDSGKVWKGHARGAAMPTHLDFGYGATPASVQALGDDVYSGGSVFGGGRVWKNGAVLYNFNGPMSHVNSIFVAEQ